MTQVAPASRSARASSTQVAGVSTRRRILRPDLGDDGERAAARRMRAALRLGRGDRGRRSPRLPEPAGGRPLEALLGTALQRGDLEQRASGAGDHVVSPQEPELGIEPGVEVGAAPAELPDVDVRRRPTRGWRARPERAGRRRSRVTPCRRGLRDRAGRRRNAAAGTVPILEDTFTMVQVLCRAGASVLRVVAGMAGQGRHRGRRATCSARRLATRTR